MVDKKLLYLLPTFAPAGGTGSLRMVKQIKEMVRRGASVQVVTRAVSESPYLDESLLEEIPEACIIHRIKNKRERWWNVFAYQQKIRDCFDGESCDWLITTSPSDYHHFLGAVLSWWNDCPWHCDLRDPIGLGSSRGRWLGWVKERIIPRSDLLTTAWPPGDLLAGTSVNSERATWIPNVFDPEDFVESTETQPANGPLRMVHTGSLHAPDQTPMPVLRAFKRGLEIDSINRNQMILEFIGATIGESLGESIQEFLQANSLGDLVVYRQFLSHDEVVQKLADSDLGLVFKARKALSYKFSEYLGARLPMLIYCPEDSPMSRLARQARSARWVEYGNEKRLQEVFVEFVNHRPAARENDQFREFFSLRRVGEMLERLYQNRCSTDREEAVPF